MLNKRQALIGYVVYQAGKVLVRLKLRKEPLSKTKRIAGGAALAAAGATVGGLVFWRKRRSGSDESAGS